jgi:hypothetical protein
MKVKVTHRKLGQDRVHGWAHLGLNHIELDSRLKGRRHLLYLVHEMLHLLNPDWSESKVVKQSRELTKLLWEQNYRRIEN